MFHGGILKAGKQGSVFSLRRFLSGKMGFNGENPPQSLPFPPATLSLELQYLFVLATEIHLAEI